METKMMVIEMAGCGWSRLICAARTGKPLRAAGIIDVLEKLEAQRLHHFQKQYFSAVDHIVIKNERIKEKMERRNRIFTACRNESILT